MQLVGACLVVATSLMSAINPAFAREVDAWRAPTPPDVTKTCLMGLYAARGANFIPDTVLHLDDGRWLLRWAASSTLVLRASTDGGTIIAHDGFGSSLVMGWVKGGAACSIIKLGKS